MILVIWNNSVNYMDHKKPKSKFSNHMLFQQMKHIPIQAPEFQNFKLLLLDFSTEWIKEYDKNHIQIFSKKVISKVVIHHKTHNSSIHCVKVIAHCKGVLSNQLFSALCDDVYMSKLDPHIIDWKIVDRIDSQNYVSYCKWLQKSNMVFQMQ
jgi:hypothetical protein